MVVRKTRFVAVALVLSVALSLSGCVSTLFPSNDVRSTPTGENVSAALAPFYGQVLSWKNCGSTTQCATAKAPLDWSDPARDSIALALVRHTATGGESLGSLLVNPGGPGGSGFDLVNDSIDFAVSTRLQEHFDIVGFDPRGVNRSTAVSCATDPSTLDSFLYDIVPGERGSDQWVEAYRQVNADFGASCLKNTGDLLGFVDTVSAARDLDLLRAILGDKKLNYLGYSYGTFLGATYADLYPENTGRLVLDGAVDPTTSSFDVSLTQAKGFESALRAFLADCIAQSDCPFTSTPFAAMGTIRDLLDRLDASPIRAEDGRLLGSDSMTIAIILPLYSQDNWPYLRQLFTDVMQGDASFAFTLADSYNGRNPDGTYLDNSLESRVAINCLDYTAQSDVTVMRSEAEELARLAPVLGPQLAYGDLGCSVWPFASQRDRAAIHAAGSADILVVGTTNDPATPYVWAENLASQLENGHLVTYDGEGHTAYNKSNSCVDDTVDNFFIKGAVPETDPKC